MNLSTTTKWKNRWDLFFRKAKKKKIIFQYVPVKNIQYIEQPTVSPLSGKFKIAFTYEVLENSKRKLRIIFLVLRNFHLNFQLFKKRSTKPIFFVLEPRKRRLPAKERQQRKKQSNKESSRRYRQKVKNRQNDLLSSLEGLTQVI